MTYGRVKPLAEQDALPQTDLDRAKGELDAAKAAVFSAQAKVDEAQLNLGYATITSPLTGVASRALQRQGAYVNSLAESANLTYVAALDPIWVNFSISQNQMARYKELQDKGHMVPPKGDNFDVELVLPGGGVYPQRGKIGFADPVVQPGHGVVPRARGDSQSEVRPAARHVRDRSRAWARCGRTRSSCPQLAVQQGSNGHLVYVVNASGVAEIRPVVVGDYYGDKDIVIQQGLAKGDRVVVEGVLKVVPGQPVKIVAPGAAPADHRPRSTRRQEVAPAAVAHVHAFLHRPADPVVGHLDPVRAGRPGRDVGRADRAVPGDGAALGEHRRRRIRARRRR